MESHRWIIALTGASGMSYGLRLVEEVSLQTSEVHVIVSDAGQRVLKEEHNLKFRSIVADKKTLFPKARDNLIFHRSKDIGALPSSGSAHFSGMVVVPCSMASLGAIATGAGTNLIHRAADVTLKEGRQLILVPRETPVSTLHLENMCKLSRLGVKIVPAMPGFYTRPQSIEELVDMMVMKILDQMRIPNEISPRWQGTSSPSSSVVELKRGYGESL